MTSRRRVICTLLEWDPVLCYAMPPLGVLWLLDLAQTKTSSVDGWVKEVVGRSSLVLWLVLVRYCALFGAREWTRLCLPGRLRGRRERKLTQSWVGCKNEDRCNGPNDLCFFLRKRNGPFGKDIC